MRTARAIFCLSLALLFACARAPLKDPQDAMRPAGVPRLSDDLPLDPLFTAIEAEERFIASAPGFEEFRFGKRRIPKVEYLASLRRFVELGRAAATPAAFFEAVGREYEFLEVYGQEKWGDTFISSYYDPLVPGSMKKTARFSQPIYALPDDLITLDLTPFDAKYSDERKLRGRLNGKALLPYYTREEIDSKSALQGRKLEICHVDPWDAFLIHVQGSATVELEDGKRLRLAYAEKNGQKYESLGKTLKDAIAPEDVNLDTMEKYLKKQTPEALQLLLNRNPSYVFFKPSTQDAVTSLGMPATDGRTIATDQKFFPKGALAFLVTTKPRLAEAGSPAAASVEWDPLARFVLDQDIGGAITGGGRVDLFWGHGDQAKRHAGLMKQRGVLYYLVPREK